MGIINIIVLGYAALVFCFVCFFRIVLFFERSEVRRLASPQKRIETLIKQTFPESMHTKVYACLEQYSTRLKDVFDSKQQADKVNGFKNTYDTSVILLMQISVLKLANGSIEALLRLTEHPEFYAYRDILLLAGEAG